MGYSQQVKEDAAKAAAVLKEKGWCQGMLRDRSGRCCARGAMVDAVKDDYRRDDALYWAFRKEVGDRTPSEWNDFPGRTAEEVIAVFDRIANS